MLIAGTSLPTPTAARERDRPDLRIAPKKPCSINVRTMRSRPKSNASASMTVLLPQL